MLLTIAATTIAAAQTPPEAPPEVPVAPVPVEAPPEAVSTEETPAVDPRAPEVPDPEAERLAAIEAELAATRERLAALEKAAAEEKLARIPPDRFTVDMEGHYRVRGYLFNHLWASQGTGDAYRDARYLDQRLWLRPKFDYKGLAKLWVEFRALDDVVFGDNASLSSTALFAADPSTTDIEGHEIPSVTLGRVWTELTLPVGLLRVGRMPSDWGMRLLVGPGDGFDEPFGEARYPSTNDRILFATRPIAILDAILGKEDREIPLFLAVAVDRLVEDPLFTYYGYTCAPGVSSADEGFDPRCDGDGDGVTDLDHSYQDDTRTEDARPLDWWADQNDDVWQMVYVFVYRGEGIDYLGGTGDLSAGVYAVNRHQRETDSNVWIVDGYFKSDVHRVLLEGEAIAISGKTRALALPDVAAADPLAKEARIFGFAARAGYDLDPVSAVVEVGSASGDSNVLDGDFTGRALHPDHNVGILLYEQVVATVTASIRTTAARGLWSNGGVYSSAYVFPRVTVEPLADWQILAGGVAAWPNKPDGAVLRCRDDDPDGCDTPSTLQATADLLGWELDLAVKHRWHEHLRWSLEGAYAHATDRLPLETAGLNPKGNFFTVQSRVAWEF